QSEASWSKSSCCAFGVKVSTPEIIPSRPYAVTISSILLTMASGSTACSTGLIPLPPSSPRLRLHLASHRLPKPPSGALRRDLLLNPESPTAMGLPGPLGLELSPTKLTLRHKHLLVERRTPILPTIIPHLKLNLLNTLL